ncbi:MAG: hypothetical protein DRP42_01290 [Tenericutes bacterium]|nr:MAG: hypothetical protein DRP42_01290 [Mycoplasmatota bacterium]
MKADHSPLNEDSFGPYRQSERTHIYEEHIQMLLDKGEAYECHCSPEELEVETNRQKEAGLAPKYSGKCKTNPEPTEGITPSIRLEVPAQ